MSRPPRRRLVAISAALLTGLSVTAAVAATSPGAQAASSSNVPAASTLRHACAAPRVSPVRTATCFAVYRTGVQAGPPGSGSKPVTPGDIQSAYHLSRTAGAGQVIGIVDAQDDPKAESDLATFRARYGLPACTTANGCFRKVNQMGRPAPLPAGDQGWGLEISLDLDAVSSACPACSILLVEGRSPGFTDLGAAVNTAVRLGADVVFNSYGATEFNGMGAYDRTYYLHPNVPIVASSGDEGFGPAAFPAVLANVIGVGGTTLNKARATARGWSEQVWFGASSGCSAYVAKPAWQKDTHCLMRTVADVSADADPDSGLLVQDSYGFSGQMATGGTSLAAPLVAAMIAEAGHTSAVHDASGIYAHPGRFNDVVGGENGYCGGDYLCNGKVGYDAPSGVGTPAGVSGL